MCRSFLYLVAIMDWASRCVLAWQLSNTLDADLCVDALDEALARYGRPEIFNSDQRSQFTSFAFTGRLQTAEIRISMDGRGPVHGQRSAPLSDQWRSRPRSSSGCGRTLKYEAVYLHEIADGFTARRVIGDCIAFYNAERPRRSRPRPVGARRLWI